MKKLVLLFLLVSIMACKNSAKENEISAIIDPPPTISVEDFMKNSEQGTFRLSPDGSHMAYLAPYKTRMNIHVKAME